MASSVVKRIPLIRFPARVKVSAPPPAASAPAAASSASRAESKTAPTTGIDAAGSSRPLHSSVPSQKPARVVLRNQSTRGLLTANEETTHELPANRVS